MGKDVSEKNGATNPTVAATFALPLPPLDLIRGPAAAAIADAALLAVLKADEDGDAEVAEDADGSSLGAP